MDNAATSGHYPFLAGGGELGALTRAFDWSTTALGQPDTWPQSLRTIVSTILSCRFPMFLWWGDDLIQFYNDAYRPSLGNNGKHPLALGQRGADCWPEIWPIIQPLIDQVRTTGEPTWSENQLIPIYRNGQLEDVYWTFGYSAVLDESDRVGGVLVVCQETTQQVSHDRQLRNLYQQAPLAIGILRGPTFVVELANPRICEIWNRTEEQMLGKPVFEVLTEAASHGFEERLTGVLQTGIPFVGNELPVPLMRNGQPQTVYVNLVYAPQYAADGRIEGIIVVATEVTEQVLARRKVAESEELYRTMVELAPVAIGTMRGENLIIETANQKVLDILHKPASIIGKPWLEALPELVGQPAGQIIRDVYRTGVPYSVAEFEAQLEKNGRSQTGYYNFSYLPIREGGAVTGILQVAIDVTEQVLARRTIQDEQDRLTTILAQLPVGVMIAQPNGELTYGNAQAAQIFRHPMLVTREIKDYANWPVFDPVTGDAVPAEQTPMARTLLHGETIVDMELKVLRGDDSWGYISANTSPIYDGNNQLHFGLAAFMDITNQKNTEERLRLAEERQAFLVRLSDKLRVLTDADTILQTSATMLGEHLNANRVYYADINEELDFIILRPDYARAGLPGIAGRYRYQDFRSAADDLKNSQPVRVNDVLNNPVVTIPAATRLLALNIAAYLSVPLSKNGQLVWNLTIAAAAPRQWTESEMALVQEVAERTWADVERARTQEALRVSEERLQALIHSLPGGAIFVVDHELRYLLAEGKAIYDVGLKPADFTGKTIFEVQEDDLAQQQKELYKQALNGQSFVHEHQVSTRHFLTHGVPLRSASGAIYAVLAVSYDITDRKLAEETLRQQEERTRIAIEAADMGTWEWNLLTDEVHWNEQHFRLFGMTPHPDGGEAPGPQQPLTPNDFTRHVHPDDRDRVWGDLERAIQEKTIYEAEFRAVRDDGRIRWMSNYGRITGETDGRASRISGVIFDIDDRKQAEEALRESALRKDEFLAMLAHELRNPLAPIRNLLQLLQLTSSNDETVGSAVTMMSRQVDHLVRLVDDLLDVSRISRGKVELRRQRLDLTTLVRQAAEAARSLYESGHRQLSVTLPASPLWVNGDATRLTQVVTNLLTNGVRYTGDNGQVALSVEKVDPSGNPVVSIPGEALLRVRDDGIGLAPDQLTAIFDLFTQVDTSLARAQGGLGLGLTLVRKLTEMHGGRVEARSAGLGMGSEFLIHLPLFNDTKPNTMSNTNTQTASAPNRRILVVDDNRDAADTLTMLLKLKKHEVHKCYSGQEALDAGGSIEPDVVLLDIGMPVLNGYETARLIRQQPWGKDVVLIALTGYGQEEDKRLSQEAGFDTHVVKPVDLALLTGFLTSLKTSPDAGS